MRLGRRNPVGAREAVRPAGADSPGDGEAVGTAGLSPGLYVVATPIGNLEDLTRRAERVLATADTVICEDSRVTAKLLGHLGLRRPLIVYNEHSAQTVRPQVLERLRAGQAMALTSDAGTPLVSDPGYKLIRAAIDQGSAVIPVPGPSAVLAGLAAAGLPTDRFLFAGFLPPKDAARRTAFSELAGIRATLVLFESTRRLGATLRTASDVLGPRPAAVARELTKLHEEVRRGDLARLAEHYATAPTPRGEIVLLIGPSALPAAPGLDRAEVETALREALRHLRPRAAAAELAGVTGLPVNELYRLAMTLKTP